MKNKKGQMPFQGTRTWGKNAQVKIQQMAFLLLALTLFFVLVGLFVIVFRFAGLKESATALEEKNALLLTTKIANSPEFSCGNVYGTGNINCMDGDKIMALKNNIEDYGGFWGSGVYNIEIRKIYPIQKEKECDLSNYPDCNTIRIITGEVKGFSTENFVSLCRKESESGKPYNKCELAKVLISYEPFA
ncbi:hypothetical protein HN832_02600 [archaeon]|nr:hypothetical protein [archaeon]MBT4373244.1 hypothetical protein [archaeon]MBT4531589.1 hypothetical protein [archaeon]MBT7001233.1 hypothetical protein [archaeon]MBT7282281.1 hypothetical protein [archaeon]